MCFIPQNFLSTYRLSGIFLSTYNCRVNVRQNRIKPSLELDVLVLLGSC